MGEENPHAREIRASLGEALRSRFEWRHDLADLDQAITQFRLVAAAYPVGHPQRSVSLWALSSALLVRFGVTGGMADFTESATCVLPGAELDLSGEVEESRS
jgi:hypothetical protein